MHDSSLTLVSTLAWAGAIGTVAAYALVSQRRMSANSVRFQLINVVGAGLLALNAALHGSWPSAASNIVWMFFGAQALVAAREAVGAGMARHWRRARTGWGHRGPHRESHTLAA